jgi:hypothetical protein
VTARKKDPIWEGRPFFSPEAQLKPWISDSRGKRFQPEPKKKPRLKMDATLSRFLVFGLAPDSRRLIAIREVRHE